jgi:hypothetical protein
MRVQEAAGPRGPFVGVAPFDEQSRAYFFGRDREARELFNLLVAQRAVLFHAPSGAGKTSLIQAALILSLRENGFDVPPPIRVGRGPGAGAPRPEGNRYLGSVLESLHGPTSVGSQGVSATVETDFPARLGRLLAERPWVTDAARRGEEAPEERVLIFDQFEEILTADPFDRPAKRAFFEQVGLALRDPGLWALLAMRDDYVAALEPYVLSIPNRFEVRFRLDLLDERAARLAIRRPIEVAGKQISDEAVGALVNDLRKVRRQQVDRAGPEALREDYGPYVEPVQLQVVCERLWRQWRDQDPGAGAITREDVQRLGNVDRALEGYFADKLRAIARNDPDLERKIRFWIGEKLITPQGVRGLVLKTYPTTEGLDNEVLQQLVDHYLVRAESRRGETWFELVHDRLIEPIRRDNLAWREKHLHMVQRRAEVWHKNGRLQELLLRDQELAAAERWATESVGMLTAIEQEFLAACRTAQDRAERERAAQESRERQRRQITIGLTVGRVVTLILSGVAVTQWWRAEILRRNAERLSALSIMERGLNYCEQGEVDLGILYLARSLKALPPRDPDLLRVIRTQLSGWRHRLHPFQEQLSHGGPVRAVAFRPDGKAILTGSDDHTAQLWDAATGKRIGPPLPHEGRVVAVAVRPDGQTILTGGDDDTARLWDAATGQPIGPPLRHQGWVRAVAVRPDGQAVLTGSFDNTARLWRVPAPLEGQPERIVLWTQVVSGQEIDDEGGIRFLDDPTWRRYRQELQLLGGPPPT